MKLVDVDKLNFPNTAIFDMKLHGDVVPMVRLLDLQQLVPAVDAVPVVRCKDCRYWRHEVDTHTHWVCTMYSFNERLTHTTPDFFCAGGLRRDDNADGKAR